MNQQCAEHPLGGGWEWTGYRWLFVNGGTYESDRRTVILLNMLRGEPARER